MTKVSQKEIDTFFFDLVSNPDDWRAPIEAVVKVPEGISSTVYLGLINNAVEFFTGTSITATITGNAPREFKITALGYRNGPAGP